MEKPGQQPTRSLIIRVDVSEKLLKHGKPKEVAMLVANDAYAKATEAVFSAMDAEQML